MDTEERREQFDDTAPGTGAGEKRPRKKKNWLWISLFAALILGVAFGSFTAGRRSCQANNIAAYSETAAGGEETGHSEEEVLEKIKLFDMYVDNYYLNDVDRNKVVENIYDGYVKGLDDPYAEYYTQDDYMKLMEEDSGEYEGIGVLLYKDPETGYPVVDGVFRDSPAFREGIQVGDYLFSVNGKVTMDMDLQDVVNEIRRGDKKTATIVVYRDNKELTFKVKKEKVQIDSVSYEMKENKVGYISVSQFIENTGDKFDEAVTDLEKQGMKSLIIDLRNNGGGLVSACTQMLSRVVPEGKLLVYTQDKNGNKNEFHSNSKKTLKIPVVILVNGNTASASEIMTGCLKDYGMATVVGTKTYGKGIVQNIFPLADGSAIKFTVANYYTPKGNYIHEKGIEPDEKVELDDEAYREALEDESKDTQLKKAMEILK